MAKITNLFNLDISQIKHNGTEVKLIKLNGDVIFRKTSQSYGVYVPYQFRDDLDITEIDVIVNESHTDLSYMFCNCNNLTYANAEDWSVGNVTNMSYMFYNCYDLEDLDVSNWDTSNVTNMSYMFYDIDLSILDLSNFNTNRVNNMSYMFAYGNPTTLDLSNFNTSSVSNMMGMFESCYSVRTLDLSNFNTYRATNMARMFCNCSNLIALNLSNFTISSSTNVNWMFQGCDRLNTLRLNNCDNTTIRKIIESSDFPTGTMNPSRTIYCKEKNATGLTPPTSWKFSYIDDDEEPDIPLYEEGDYNNNSTITEVRTMVNNTHTNLSGMFYNCTNLVSVNTEDWDTSNVGTMYNMFANCTSLVSLDLSNFVTSNVMSMQNMFSNCSSLQSLDMRKWDTNKTNSVAGMFSGCTALHTLHLNNCDSTTISKIIASSNFPADNAGTIYCNETEAEGLTAPGNWQFSFI